MFLNNTTSVYVLCDVVKLMGSFGSHCTRWSRILASDIDTTRTYEVVENDVRVARWEEDPVEEAQIRDYETLRCSGDTMR